MGRDPDEIQREFATKNNTFTKIPLIVLINEGSASASEIVAGALQDHEKLLYLGQNHSAKALSNTNTAFRWFSS